MKVELVSLEGVRYQEDAYALMLNTLAGHITILPNHEPYMGVVLPGVISIRRHKDDPDSKLEHYAAQGGVLEVTPVGARVLVDEATHGDDISEAEAEKAHQEALALKQKATSQVELDKAQSLVDRQAVRLEVARIRRRHNR